MRTKSACRTTLLHARLSTLPPGPSPAWVRLLEAENAHKGDLPLVVVLSGCFPGLRGIARDIDNVVHYLESRTQVVSKTGEERPLVMADMEPEAKAPILKKL